MSTKKKISDIDKAIEEMQQRRKVSRLCNPTGTMRDLPHLSQDRLQFGATR